VGTVFKKTVTRPLPPGAEIIVRKGERLARWKDRRGKTRTAPLTVGKDGSERIVTESPYYVAKWRDGAGVVCVRRPAARMKPPPGKCWRTSNAGPNWCART
jgi:hypothetical protein